MGLLLNLLTGFVTAGAGRLFAPNEGLAFYNYFLFIFDNKSSISESESYYKGFYAVGWSSLLLGFLFYIGFFKFGYY